MHLRVEFAPVSPAALMSLTALPFFSKSTLSGNICAARRMALRACTRWITFSSLVEMVLMESLVERLFSLRSVSNASTRTRARKVSMVVMVSLGLPRMNVTALLSRSANCRRAFTDVMMFLFLADSMAYHSFLTRA